MYLITNRALNKGEGLSVFGKSLSPKGPNEIRVVAVNKKNKSWSVKVVTDKLTKETVKELKKKYSLDIDINTEWHGSLRVACELFERAQNEKKSILFYVHGYNNDVSDVINAAHTIEKQYKDVIVVPFTWPANGGGTLSGTASYLSDKSDARASVFALNRVVGKIQYFHALLTAANKIKLQNIATKKHPNNAEKSYALFSSLMSKQCDVTLNLLCHSMGNYLLKHTLSTSDNVTSKLVFDNICLVAADANNARHNEWVGKLDSRKRIYIVINENDFALKFARIKPGDEQLARLGHYTRQLDSPNAYYIDVTDAQGVGNEHAYFKGETITGNEKLKDVFMKMFTGQSIENLLVYKSDNNSYVLSD